MGIPFEEFLPTEWEFCFSFVRHDAFSVLNNFEFTHRIEESYFLDIRIPLVTCRISDCTKKSESRNLERPFYQSRFNNSLNDLINEFNTLRYIVRIKNQNDFGSRFSL